LPTYRYDTCYYHYLAPGCYLESLVNLLQQEKSRVYKIKGYVTEKLAMSFFIVVEIHEVHRGNKWMGSSNLATSNERTTSQTAGWGLKMKQDNK